MASTGFQWFSMAKTGLEKRSTEVDLIGGPLLVVNALRYRCVGGFVCAGLDRVARGVMRFDPTLSRTISPRFAVGTVANFCLARFLFFSLVFSRWLSPCRRSGFPLGFLGTGFLFGLFGLRHGAGLCLDRVRENIFDAPVCLPSAFTCRCPRRRRRDVQTIADSVSKHVEGAAASDTL